MSAHLAFLISILLALPGFCEVRRLALVVGVDEGLDKDEPLRYASRDAREMAALLGRLGGFAKTGIQLRTDISVSELKSEMAILGEKIRQSKREGAESMVLFYYSGHGDSGSLHLAGKKLTRSEISGLLDGLECDLKIIIIDACESGGLLRKKGATLVRGGDIRIHTGLQGKGSVYLSSSSRGEWSQESDEYGGGIFSHHLMNGMRGLADLNRDNTVTLMEAFKYAQASTQMEKVNGEGLEQNPAFDFDLVGVEDPVLTHIGPGNVKLRLSGIPPGPLYIYRGEASTKVWISKDVPVEYEIPAGSYLLKVDGKDVVYLKSVQLGWSGSADVDFGDFRASPASVFRSKGPSAFTGFQHGLRLSLASSGFLDWLGFPVVSADYTLNASRLRFATGIGYGWRSIAAQGTENDFRLFRWSGGVQSSIFKSGFGRVWAGLGGEWDYILQIVRDNNYPEGPVVSEEGVVESRRKHGLHILRFSVPAEFETLLAGRIGFYAGIAWNFSWSFGEGAGPEPDLMDWEPKAGIAFRFL